MPTTKLRLPDKEVRQTAPPAAAERDPGDVFRRLLRLRAWARRRSAENVPHTAIDAGEHGPCDDLGDPVAETAVRAVDRAFGKLFEKEGSTSEIKEAVNMLEGVRYQRAVDAIARVHRRNSSNLPGAPLVIDGQQQEELEGLLQLEGSVLRNWLVQVCENKGAHVAAVAALAKVDGISARTIEERLKEYRERTECVWPVLPLAISMKSVARFVARVEEAEREKAQREKAQREQTRRPGGSRQPDRRLRLQVRPVPARRGAGEDDR